MSAGTVPLNFPPENFIPIGALLTGTSLRNTGPIPTSVFFTAPVSGIYGLQIIRHIVSTDGAGTIDVTWKMPYNIAQSVLGKPVTADVNGSSVGWMNRGDSVTASVALTGVTGTVYDLYICMRRLF